MSLPAKSLGRETWILFATGCAALLPYAIYHRLFHEMFWFGDEFDLVDQIDRLGFWRWVWLAFAENFVPLFKVLWGGAILAFGGSYAAMLAIVWLTHGLNVALLGRLMRTCGLPWMAVFFAQIVFGLTCENFETLAWSVQWSAMLSVTFMLLGLDLVFRSRALGAPLMCAFASGLSFSRGALTGPLIGCASFICDRESGFLARVARALVYLLPAVIVAGLIFLLAKGNQHSMGEHRMDALTYGTWYFCLNPAYLLVATESWGWHTTIVFGAVKVGLIVWALRHSRAGVRRLFVILVLFDLSNAVLLGIGRYHTGIATCISSRYQYAAMVSAMPMAGYWLAVQWAKLKAPRPYGTLAVGAALAVLAVFLCFQWPSEMDRFSEWRGTRSRRILFVDVNPPADAVPGIPGLEMDRAKFLIAKYHLH